jgi:hypothetical protein
MEYASHKLLSTIERLTEHLGPLTTLFDSIVERIAPKTRAQASCAPYYCHSSCSVDTCFLWWKVRYDVYSDTLAGCYDQSGAYCFDAQPCGTC